MDAHSFISWLQHHLLWLDSLLRVLSIYGNSRHHLLIAAVVFWTGYTRVGGRLAMGTLISTIAFAACRQFFASPRPYWNHPDLFHGLTEKAYGMPSGHTQNAALFWGLLAYSLKSRWFCLAAGILVIATGISRLYLGLHYPSQVAIGLATGLLLLLLFIALEQTVINFFRRLPPWKRVVLTTVITLLPLVFILLAREVFGVGSGNGSALPYSQLMRFNGLLTGCAIGLVLSSVSTPSVHLFITRALPGAISVIILWKFMPELNDLKTSPKLYYSARLLEFMLLSLWVTLVWPWLHKCLFSRINRL